jgi:hypothetical protein
VTWRGRGRLTRTPAPPGTRCSRPCGPRWFASPPTEDPIQRLFAGISPLWCLPQSITAPDARPVGTVLRAGRLRELAAEAGFGAVEVVPIAHPLYRFYRLQASQ